MSVVRYWWAAGLGLVALLVVLAFWNPAVAGGPDFCLFHLVTGVSCPACGLTRAAAAFAQGRFAESLRWHPLFLLLAAEAALLWLVWGLALRRKVNVPAGLRRFAPWAAIANGVLLLVVWCVRLANGKLPG